MTISEQLSYTRGLIDAGTSNEKALNSLLSNIEMLVEELDTAYTRINILEEKVEDLCDEMDDFEFDDDFDDDDFDDCGDDCEECTDLDELFDPEGELFEIICPTCDEKIFLDETMIGKGSMNCPACSEPLEFDTDEL